MNLFNHLSFSINSTTAMKAWDDHMVIKYMNRRLGFKREDIAGYRVDRSMPGKYVLRLWFKDMPDLEAPAPAPAKAPAKAKAPRTRKAPATPAPAPAPAPEVEPTPPWEEEAERLAA